MKKYLYLTKKEWITPWVKGGIIPISLASKYLSVSRFQTSTPDENVIHNSPIDLTRLSPLLAFKSGGGVKGLTMTGNYINGERVPDVVGADYYKEDGLILSFLNRASKEIADKLGKQACIEIYDIDHLKDCIDEKLGIKGRMACVEYAQDHQRNHFLKSVEDSWQDEFRLFWEIREERSVEIPAGIGRELILGDMDGAITPPN